MPVTFTSEKEGGQEPYPLSLSGESRVRLHEVTDSFFLYLRPTARAVIVRRNAELFCVPTKNTVARNNQNIAIYGHAIKR